MLYMIGLGLSDEKDLSIRGKDALASCSAAFLEGYTSILSFPVEEFSTRYGVDVSLLGRDGVEKEAERILTAAQQGDAAFLVIGDVFSATTHTDLYLRAVDLGIEVSVIHNTSIMAAIGSTGIDLYKFGRATTFVFPEGSYRPTSFVDVIEENLSRGLHTLCLLDIKTDQNRFMTVNDAVTLLLEIASEMESAIGPDTFAIGCARMGWDSQQIVTGTLSELLDVDFGAPLHTLIIPGKLHEIEERMLQALEEIVVTLFR